MRRIAVFLGLLAALALVAAAGVPAGSAQVQSPPAQILLKTNDRFELAAAPVACKVVQQQAGFTNRLVCFRETKPRSYTPRLGSYEVELAEGGVKVARVGDRGFVFDRGEVPPAGAAAGSAKAKALFGGAARLASRRDQAFVASTNIVCRPYSRQLRAVLCVLLGGNGHVQEGSYLVWISDRGVLLAQSRNGKAVIAFQRVHGH